MSAENVRPPAASCLSSSRVSSSDRAMLCAVSWSICPASAEAVLCFWIVSDWPNFCAVLENAPVRLTTSSTAARIASAMLNQYSTSRRCMLTPCVFAFSSTERISRSRSMAVTAFLPPQRT